MHCQDFQALNLIFPPLMHSLIFNIFWSVLFSLEEFFFLKEILFVKLEIPEIHDIILHLALHLPRESEFSFMHHSVMVIEAVCYGSLIR